MTAPRYDWIDIAKGLGILLVVYGHCRPPLPIAKFIYAFHMPVFFFISGFLYKNHKNGFKTFIEKIFQRLLIPYFIFSLISIPVEYARFKVGETGAFSTATVINGFFNLDGTVIYNRPLWFLMCLFNTMILFYFIIRLHPALQWISVFVSIGLSYFFMINQIRLPFSIHVALLALSFMFFGNKSHKLVGLLQKQNPAILISTSLSAGVVTWVVASLHERIRMGSLFIDNWPLFFIGAFTGILMLFSISWLIAHQSQLVYLGRNSLQIMINHFYILSMFGVILMISEIRNFLFEGYPFLTSVLFFVFYLALCIPANRVYNFALKLSDMLIPALKYKTSR